MFEGKRYGLFDDGDLLLLYYRTDLFEEAGIDPITGKPKDPSLAFHDENSRGGGTRDAWKIILSAGQGIGEIKDAPSAAEIIARLREDYSNAAAVPANYS